MLVRTEIEFSIDTTLLSFSDLHVGEFFICVHTLSSPVVFQKLGNTYYVELGNPDKEYLFSRDRLNLCIFYKITLIGEPHTTTLK